MIDILEGYFQIFACIGIVFAVVCVGSLIKLALEEES